VKRYESNWLVKNITTQILATTSQEFKFEDWGEENLLLAIESGKPYIDDPLVSVYGSIPCYVLI
jgi:hypothetical protein